jgi:hypothetical protein
MDGEAWVVSLSQFKQLPPHDQVVLLVPEGDLTPDAAAATAHRVAKLVGATIHPKLRHELLAGLIGEEAGRHLPWCAHIFERLRLQRQVRSALFSFLPTLQVLEAKLPTVTDGEGPLLSLAPAEAKAGLLTPLAAVVSVSASCACCHLATCCKMMLSNTMLHKSTLIPLHIHHQKHGIWEPKKREPGPAGSMRFVVWNMMLQYPNQGPP